MARGQSFDDVEVPGKDDTPRMSDFVEMWSYPDGKFAAGRFIGSLYAYGGHWVKTKKKDGKIGSFFTPCSAFDKETGKFDSTKNCKWCDNADLKTFGDGTIRRSLDFFSNMIDRKAQRNKPEDAQAPSKSELKTGFITKDSETWTPVKVTRCTGNVVKQIKSLKELNVHEDDDGNSKAYAVSDRKYGMDVNLKYDSKAASPQAAYAVQRGDSTPLKKSEAGYLIWDIEGAIDSMPSPSEEDTEKAFDDWAKRNKISVDGGSHDEDDDDEPPAKSKKKKVADDFDDDEDDDPPPKKKKRPVDDDDEDEPTPKKKRPAKDDFDDDDEEEPPAKSKSKKKPIDDDDDEPAPRKKKRPADDDDFDDEEPPAKSKKRPVKDDFDDEEDEPAPEPKKKRPVDDDDEDEPPAKSKSKKKPVDDFDDDEDDEPLAKSKKKAPAKKSRDDDDEDDDDPPPKKKKRPVDDDEDDDL